MCVLLLAFRHHPRYPVVLAANRDEFYARPSLPAAFRDDAPDILAGRDLEQGGTWLGVTRSGRWAAVTNYRAAGSQLADARSRGHLVTGYLNDSRPPLEHLRELERSADAYNGFTLLAGTPWEAAWLSNRGSDARAIEPGVHGLSNHLLNEPWPKVVQGRERVKQIVEGGDEPEREALFRLLADRSRASDDELPDTGLDRALERELSALFIAGQKYGTRCSTVLLIRDDGHGELTERSFGPGGEPAGTAGERFELEPAA